MTLSFALGNRLACMAQELTPAVTLRVSLSLSHKHYRSLLHKLQYYIQYNNN